MENWENMVAVTRVYIEWCETPKTSIDWQFIGSKFLDEKGQTTVDKLKGYNNFNNHFTIIFQPCN